MLLLTAGAIVCMAFMHNLLRRHSACNVLLNRPHGAGPPPAKASERQATPNLDVASVAGPDTPDLAQHEDLPSLAQLAAHADGHDVYDFGEHDPALSRAVESSLWEVESLRNHYYHQVASYTAIFDKDLTDKKRSAEVDMSGLLAASYSGLAKAELDRRLKAVPVAMYAEAPQTLFHEVAQTFPGWSIA